MVSFFNQLLNAARSLYAVEPARVLSFITAGIVAVVLAAGAGPVAVGSVSGIVAIVVPLVLGEGVRTQVTAKKTVAATKEADAPVDVTAVVGTWLVNKSDNKPTPGV